MNSFGRLLGNTGSTSNPYRYGGEWGYMTDPSGLLQLGARFYWPELGRFVQQDPIGDGMNWYAYAGGNPVVAVDPSGLYWDTVHASDSCEQAQAAGLNTLDTRASGLIAAGAWSIDQLPASQKTGSPHVGGAALLTYADEIRVMAADWYNQGYTESAFVLLGLGAHAIQDYYAHPGSLNWVRTEHAASRLPLSPVPNPDDPASYPQVYAQSVAHLQEYLRGFKGMVKPSPGGKKDSTGKSNDGNRSDEGGNGRGKGSGQSRRHCM